MSDHQCFRINDKFALAHDRLQWVIGMVGKGVKSRGVIHTEFGEQYTRTRDGVE